MFKKLQCLVLFIGITLSSLFAQIPTGYYSTATGTGYTLKTQLYNIIKNHTDLGYTGLWTTYQTSDRDYFYENDGTILDLYSENPTGTDPYNFTYSTDQCGTYAVEGDCYNREHMIPQSIFKELSPMVSDAHFITATDGKVNGMRSNYPHGMVGTATYTSQNGSKLGSALNSGYSAGYSGTVFEPINAFKGDIARMYFYFATRYENVITTWGISYAMFNGTSNQVFAPTFLSILLAWNALDPVSASEIARNNAVYARQNNRNPFIDHPEYVNLIWSTSTDTQAPTAPTNLAASSVASTTLTLGWTASTDNVGVTGYDIYKNGTLLTTVTTTTYNVTGLTAATAYTFYVKAKDAAGNISAASSTINVTTTSTSDTQAPTAPTNLVASSVASTTLTLGWTASTDNVGVTGYVIYKNGVLLTTVTTTTYNVTGLTASTAYTFYVKAKDAAGNFSAASSTINVTTTASTVSYCTSQGTSSTGEWISKVVIGAFTNSSTAAGYTDFTSKTITLTAGTATSISLTPGFSGSAYNEYWRIWIDYNGDKDFADANELAFDAGAVTNTVKTGTINVLSTASGTTRMRVSMKYNAAQTACEIFSYGEVEDYTVTFGTVVSDTQAPTVPTGVTASNITQTSATISWTASTDNVGVTGYNVYKNGTLLGSTTTTSYSLSGLTASTTYTIGVAAFDAKSNISAQGTKSFTTLATVASSKETFANFIVGGSYLTGTFLGQDGSTWSYCGARGDIAITGSAPTFGKGLTPLAYITSGTIQGGVGTLKFDWMQAFSTSVNLYVYVNSTLVKTVTGGTVNVPASSGTITVNIAGAFTFKFVQVNSTSGQVAFDNIEWTPYTLPSGMPKGESLDNSEKPNVSEFKMYPNPASNVLTIITNSNSNNPYTIVDVYGRIIERGNLKGEAIINVSTLVKGLYFVNITDDKGKTHTKKFIKE